MRSLSLLSVEQLQRAIALKEQIENLQLELDSITGESKKPKVGRPRKFGRSTEVRARLADAQKARGVEIQANGSGKAEADAKPKRKKHKMSAAGRAAVSAATKARWVRIKAEKAAE